MGTLICEVDNHPINTATNKHAGVLDKHSAPRGWRPLHHARNACKEVTGRRPMRTVARRCDNACAIHAHACMHACMRTDAHADKPYDINANQHARAAADLEQQNAAQLQERRCPG